MVTVFIPNHFLQERKYILATLLQHYLGIDIEIVARRGQLHYELAFDDRTILVKDQFFGQTIAGDFYLAADRIPDTIREATAPGLEGIPILFGEDQIDVSSNRIECGVDIFAGAFFMLTRWEESVLQDEDLHGRFPAAAALAVRSGFILRPIVDEYVALLRKWFVQLGYPMHPPEAAFRVVPTCDVDIPYYWLRQPAWKVIAGEWLKDKRVDTIRKARKKINAVRANAEQDPYDRFADMMDLAEQAGLRMQFNMLVGGITRYEGFYALSDQRIQRLISTFKQRGHPVGLHPSYNAYLDARQIREEKKFLEKTLNHPVTASRQHYLKISIPKTWTFLSDAGIREDSTLGYAAEPGFRCGTSRPFPVFDIHQRVALPLVERPLLIMDVSLRHYKNLTPAAAMVLIDAIHAQVKKHRGELIFLWHNANLGEVEGWSAWYPVFEYLMSSGTR